ncbi:transporter substrate-binding domain-containing protein [Paenirhodobacter populi]|nr:transporter substrate-binding domain-containing protein [Sinirhodobacter populi]
MKIQFLVASLMGAALGIGASASLAQDGYKVALDGTFAPHAMPNLSGEVEGFNVDLAKAIGEKLGVPIQVDAAQFSGLIPAMQAGTYDFLVAPVTVNEERSENMLFTEGFMDTNFAFVVPKGAPKRDKLEDFKGLSIAVNKGSAYESFLNDNAAEYGWTVTAYGTQTDAVEAVVTGRADANLAGATVAAWAAKQNPRVELSYEYPTGLVWALPFRKDDAATRDKIDAVLECMKTDGTMAKLSEKWFGVTPAAGTTIVTPTPGYGVPGFEGYEDTPHEVTCTF